MTLGVFGIYFSLHIMVNNNENFCDIYSVAKLQSRKIHRLNRNLTITWEKATAREKMREGGAPLRAKHRKSKSHHFSLKLKTENY